ncbi:hypothetical protein ABE424_03430 [Stenotrophomonas sp. TWI1149]|uniref:hypothetical protein n=1 Tax=unclassified Stenotrophomonas TaxID=196198 RepID=UPI00320A1114
MNKLAITLIIALPVSAAPPTSQKDRVENTGEGRTMVRTTEWPDFEGGFVAVEQRLLINEDGDPTYQYSRQSKATQLYHEAFCLEKNAQPAGGEAVLKGSIAAWICELGDENKALDPEVATPQNPGTFMDRSTDYVFANAPNGSARVGVNFHSTGSIRYSSSISGSMRGSVSVDGGRCITNFSQFYASPFSGSHVATAICIVHEPRRVSTKMEGCVPRLCGSDSGSVTIN